MLTHQQNERITRVGPGTPCGEMMRRYWHPIAASAQLPDPGTRAVRILGEDLVLYRDLAGRIGLVEPQCPHRKAGLVYGMPDECGIRCTYHGWLFDSSGQCIEQPFESFANPRSTYKDEIKIKAYPAQELGGLIFAYLGPAPAPLLPNWESYVMDDVYREIGFAMIPCNWLQTVENAGDSSHVVSTHWQYSQYVLGKLGRPDLRRHEKSSGAAGYFLRERELDGKYGVGAILFPYTDAQSDYTYQIRVPVDDTTTLHIWYMVFTKEAQECLGVSLPAQRRQQDIPTFEVPVPKLIGGAAPDWSLLDSNAGQDLAMWYTQGPIMDRTSEHLGYGDRHIVHTRKFIDDQIRLVEEGKDPINTFRDSEANICLVPEHKAPMPPLVTGDGRPDRTNAARKFSPVFQMATLHKLGPDSLNDPAY